MLIKLITFGLLFSQIISLCSKTSSIFKCSSSNLSSDQCLSVTRKGNYNEAQYIYDLRTCKKSKQCQPLDRNQDIGICVDKESLIKGFHDDKCSNNQDCYSGDCTKGKCVSIQDDGVCPGPYSCLKYSTCIKRSSKDFLYKCTPIVQSFEVCTEDSMCPFGYVCGKNNKASINKQCFKMFSIDNGEYATNSLLCKSGKTWTYDKGENYLCSTSSRTASEPCLNIGDCMITMTDGRNKFHSFNSATCSWNGFDAYSEIITSDDLYQEYLTVYNDLIRNLNEADLKNLENARKNYWMDSKLEVLAKRVFYYANMKGADDCAIKYFINGRSNTMTIIWLLLFTFVLV